MFKEDLSLNDVEWLVRHKTKPTNPQNDLTLIQTITHLSGLESFKGF